MYGILNTKLNKMEKQIKNFKVAYELDWEYEVSIEKLEEDIKLMKELGVTSVEIEAETYYDSSYVKIQTYQRREETDEEFEQRVGAVKRREEEIKRRDLEQLERLKNKYEK